MNNNQAPSLEAEEPTEPILGFSYTVHHIPFSLASDHDIPPDCPICREPFNEPPEETAVQIDLPTCQHIFGITCLQQHLSTPGEWPNKCPICRVAWYQSENMNDLTVVGFYEIIMIARGTLGHWAEFDEDHRATMREVYNLATELRPRFVGIGLEIENINRFVEGMRELLEE